MIEDEEFEDEKKYRSLTYKMIDRGILFTYLGGILCGVSIFFLENYVWVFILCLIGSLTALLVGRFLALKFMFEEKEESEESL